MSAMADLDLMLREYEGAYAAMVSHAGTSVLGHLQAADNAIRAADTLAAGLRSMLGGNELAGHNPVAKEPDGYEMHGPDDRLSIGTNRAPGRP